MDFANFDTTFFRDFLIYFQIITAIFATIFYYKYKNTNLKYFLFFIWFMTSIEFIGILYHKYINGNNTIVYNISQIIEFGFYYLLFYQVILNKTNKKLLLIAVLIYLTIFCLDFFELDFMFDYFDRSYIIGSAITVFAVVLYFSEVLTSDKIIAIDRSLLFWISVGLLIYFVPTIPFSVVRKYYVDSVTIPYIYNINYVLVFLINLFYIFGFVWIKKELKE